MTKKIKISIWLMLMSMSTLTTLNAQSCDALLKDLMEHAKGSRAFISFQIAGLGGTSYWGQYAEGTLNYSATAIKKTAPTIEYLTGEGLQYFSDRFAPVPNPGGGFNQSPYWFNKSQPDKLKFSISRGGLLINNACPTPVTLTLLTWGNTKATFCPVCKGEFMYLLDNGMVIRFSKQIGPG
jgi:hypothetical protein